MVRVAIAGTGGLARYIAHFIKDETSHTAVILSRKVRDRFVDCDRRGGFFAFRCPHEPIPSSLL
jgi:hypothetical protein